MSSKYTFGKEGPLSFDEAVSRATEAVAKKDSAYWRRSYWRAL